LNDFETETYLKGQFILGIASPEIPGELNPDYAKFFLDLYFDAYLSERQEFTITGKDIGRVNWIEFISDQLKYLHGCTGLVLADADRSALYAEFIEYADYYLTRVMEKRSPAFPIADATKHSLNGIVE
jgi:hypothetical protein